MPIMVEDGAVNRPLLALTITIALASTACDKLKKKDASATSALSTGGTAGPGPDHMKADKVSGNDGPITKDGSNDGSMWLAIDGPVIGLMVLTTDKDGNPEGGQQWDTYTAGQKVPAAAKPPYEDGDGTYQLGVWENGKAMNDAKGALVPIGGGSHKLSLYASDSGYFTKEHHFIVIAERADHSLVKSNLFTF
jgi:hypothetical protein